VFHNANPKQAVAGFAVILNLFQDLNRIKDAG